MMKWLLAKPKKAMMALNNIAHLSIMAQNDTEKYIITNNIFLLTFLYIGKLMGTL